MSHLKTINLYLVLKRKLIPTAVGEDIVKKNNQENKSYGILVCLSDW